MRPPEHPAVVALLTVPAWIYRGAVQLRNRRYDRPGAVRESAIPVVSVGNLTVGGTGKTPVVAWLAARLREMKRRPAVVSRGYGGRAGRGPLLVSDGSGPSCSAAECGDEPFLLARFLDDVPIIVGSDRVAGAELARRRGADLVLLDDGFQHRRLGRDLDILLLDAGHPFGNQRLLPAGPLREPLSGLRRADVIVVTRCGAGDSVALIENVVRLHNTRAPLLRAGHRPVGFFDEPGRSVSRPERALAFCGIGNPAGFRTDLETLGVELVDFVSYADHRPYSGEEIEGLRRRAFRLGAVLVTTEKDRARFDPPTREPQDVPLLTLRIEAEIFDAERLLARVAAVLERESRP